MELENGLPIPRAAHDTVFSYLYEMEVGQSVLVDTKTLNKQSLNASRAYAKKRYNKRFSLRTLPEGTRIWRVQ